MPRLPQIDLLSFWLGFLVATLFWFLLSRMRPLLPAIRERFRLLIRSIRERNLQGANDYLRQETVRRAQRWHLANGLFALDDILLPPLLIAPPAPVDPDAAPKPEIRGKPGNSVHAGMAGIPFWIRLPALNPGGSAQSGQPNRSYRPARQREDRMPGASRLPGSPQRNRGRRFDGLCSPPGACTRPRCSP